MKSPGLLILSDVYYPGWIVYVDGEQKQILRTDYIFRGVLCDTGEHEITFKYNPRSVRLGIILSLSALFAVFLVFIYLIIKKLFSKRGK
jgi:uncharacterized membrane protein YfhO